MHTDIPHTFTDLKIGVIGYGNFGKIWAELLSETFQVVVADIDMDVSSAIESRIEFNTVEELCRKSDVIFICVPIRKFEALILEIKDKIQPETVIFDTCSVKTHPAKIMSNHLANVPRIELICTHPMFGPGIFHKGIQGWPIVLWPLRLQPNSTYSRWKKYFSNLGLQVVEMSPEQHDQVTAYTQCLTHFVGRFIGQMQLEVTDIDPPTYKKLHSAISLVHTNSEVLFEDLQIFNPYALEMRNKLLSLADKIHQNLKLKKVDLNNL